MRVLVAAAEALGGQQCVHGTGAETLEIKGHKLESECLENCCELSSHAGIKSAVEFIAGDLDSHNVAMVPHPKLTKSESADCLFTALD
jgi:hypothetical protein